MNKIVLIGRATRDSELKHTASSTPIVNFSIAVNRPFKNANGEKESDFFNCVAFNKLAETISRYVRKGDLVGIEGRVQTRNYTDRDGNNRYSTEVMVENVEFLQPKKQEFTETPKTEDDPFGDLEF